MAAKKPPHQEVVQYTHDDKDRINNPPVGLVTPETDKDGDKKTYQYDPHLDPQLQWAGKAEHTSFQVDTVSLPFQPGKQIAVKIIDARGVESLKIEKM